MIRKIQSVIRTNRTLFENFSFLSLLQVSNLMIFLLIIPFLIRVLGKEYYGLVVFAQTVAIYFSIIVNFGFNVTATKDISIWRDDREKRMFVISSVLILKILLLLASLMILAVLITLIPFPGGEKRIYFLSMLFCLSEALFPVWYFQGIEKMRYITFINVATRLASAISLFVFIKTPQDFFLVPAILGAGTISGAIIGLIVVFSLHDNGFYFPKRIALIRVLKENIPLFISNVSSQVYVHANKLIVGTFLGLQEVAVYDIADKIVNLLKVPVFLIGQTLFPRVSRDRDVRFVKYAMVLVFLFFLFVYALLFLFAKPLIILFSGTENNLAVTLLRILGLSILPISLGLFYAELLLIPFGYLRDYARMRTGSLFVYASVLIILLACNQIGMFQLALAVLVVEIFVLTYSFLLCRKKGII